MIPLLIDCDPGHDDSMAILYAARHFELRGLTTVFGNSIVENTTRNALKICELAGLDIPVAGGMGAPLVGSFAPSMIHGASGLDGADLPEPKRRPVDMHAVTMIIEQARKAQGELVLAAIGPLTNVAVALRTEPRLARWLKCITIMGGSLDIGNAAPYAEANILKDPEAAAAVFSCDAEIYLAGLNFTRQAILDRSHAEMLRQAGGAVPETVAGMLDFYLTRSEARYGKPISPMHDPSAFVPFVRPDLVEHKPFHIQVELASPLLRGMTVADQRNVTRRPDEPEPPRANVLAGVRMDGPAATRHVIETIASYGRG